MLEKLLAIADPVNLELAHCNKSHLCLSSFERAHMKHIVDLLTPFHEALQHFSSDNLVTLSLVFPFFECLKTHLGGKESDVPMIKDMKGHMLKALGTRHPSKQQFFFKL